MARVRAEPVADETGPSSDEREGRRVGDSRVLDREPAQRLRRDPARARAGRATLRERQGRAPRRAHRAGGAAGRLGRGGRPLAVAREVTVDAIVVGDWTAAL